MTTNFDGEQLPVDALTGREMGVLRLVALGLSNRDIGEELFIAPETVRWYTKQIYSKLGVSGRIQAVNRARELLLLQDDSPSQSTTTTASARVEASPQGNLPIPMTSFIGRSHELTEVKRLLLNTRLLTLTGVGGTGKTRLALQVASQVADHFADGVYFVDLAPLHDASIVTKTIASVMGVTENPNEPQLDTLKHALAGRELLLLIDNFEHVLAAAPVVSELLASAPRLKVLLTSREPLRLSGEQEYYVPPLSLPPAESHSVQNVIDSEAGALFVKRAQMILSQFEVTDENAPAIIQICLRLDGLPLAIELAAARCKLLPPQALLSRLDNRLSNLTGGSRDAPARQRTLRQMLDWSYNLLDEHEKTLFARLAVFRGGRSLEAIEAVCAPRLPLDVFDGLASLVDKNLIQQKETPDGEPRFVMLETIHEYARERLAESGEADTIRLSYADYFVDLAERAEPELRLAQQIHWLQRLELERNNLVAVLEWSLSGKDVTHGIRLGGALFMFWHNFGFHVEGHYWTQQLYARLQETPEKYHGKFLIGAGYMAWLQDTERALFLLASALEISRKLGDQFHTAWALSYISVLVPQQEAFAIAEEGLSLFRELNHQPGIAQALNVIGELARFRGDDDRAKQAYQDCLIISEQIGDKRLFHSVLHNQSYIAQHEGDHQRTISLLRRTLLFSMMSPSNLATIIQILAGSLAAIGEPERAARLLGAAEACLERIGTFLEPVDQSELDRNIAAVQVLLDNDTFQATWAEGRRMTLEQAIAEALDE